MANPTTDEVSQGFWHACAAGQRRAAERLAAAGADLNWEPDYAHGTPLDAAGGLGTRQENVIGWLNEKGAAPPTPTRLDATPGAVLVDIAAAAVQSAAARTDGRELRARPRAR